MFPLALLITMPEYLDSEIPMVRRRASKDPKVYRYNHHTCSPTVISKYICKQGSHYAVQNFIGQDGIARSFGMMDVPSALKADDPFDMEAYGIPYSMNSRKRWKIMDELKRDISSFQDPSTGLRVTAVSLPATGCIETHVNRGSRGWLSEYHTVDEQHRVIDRKTKRTTFQSIIKPENPPRRRKGRLIRPLVQTAVETPIPREEQDRVNIWERPAHIVYQEQYFYEPTRKRNTRSKSEAYWTKRAKWEIDPQQWRSMRFRTGYKCRFDPQITQLSDFTPSYPGCMDAEQFEEDVYFMDDYASEIDELPGKNALVTLGEFVCERRKGTKQKKFRKRTREIDKDKCYSIPKDGHLQVEEEFSDSGFETTEMTVGDDLEPLDSFVTELKKNKTFDDLIRAINSDRVERIQPTSYLIDSIHHQPYRLLNKFLKKPVPIDFHGFIVLRPYCFFEYNSTRREYLRCILNDGEMENCLVLPHKKFNRTTKGEKSLIDFLPSESVVRCQSYAELDAQQFAYDELVAQMPSSSRSPLVDEDDTDGCCGICWEVSMCLSLSCGHEFCEHCWTLHSVTSIDRNHIPIKCPANDCDNILEIEQAITFLPLSLCYRYRKLLLKKLMMKPDWLYCSNCERSIHLNKITHSNRSIQFVRCDCGAAICIKCRSRAHIPINCGTAMEYRSILDKNSVTKQGVASVHVKQCPVCGSFCVRSIGCNQVRCRCDTDFCYNCCEKWMPSHFNCSAESFTKKVYLFDVERGLEKFSRTLFRRCLQHRIDGSKDSLSLIESGLKKLNVSIENHRRIMSIFRVTSEVLEMFEIYVFYLRKLRRKSVGQRKSALHWHICSLKMSLSILVFLLNTTKSMCTDDRTECARLNNFVGKIEDFLRSLLLKVI